jgi:two-component system response regulator PilR (NtrC family)
MSPMTQVKLLRVLQERKFRRLGGTEEVEANIRIIAATNRDLAKLVAAGEFREDLFYRINVIPVKLPPLRERHDDVQALAEHFVEKFAQQMKKEIQGISGAAMACLRSYSWPGNVRELENAIERAVALERAPAVLPDSLPDAVRAAAGVTSPAPTVQPAEERTLAGGFDLEQHVQGIEREYIMEALRRSNGVKKNAAELLGLSFRQFRYLLKKYNIQ